MMNGRLHPTATAAAPAPALWPRLARAHLESVIASPETPARVLIVGDVGSGKSSMLRHLAGALRDRGREAVRWPAPPDPASLPADDVLVVDDAHRLDDAELAALARRAADPDAGLVLATRPWPRSPLLQDVARALEQSRPAIVLGQLTAGDVLAYADEAAIDVDADCVDELLALCGGASWLVSAALALHDADCRDHDEIAAALHGVILHRLETLSPDARDGVERLCFAGDARIHVGDDLAAEGRAAGLLQRNGMPAPVVRLAVRSATPVDRVADLLSDRLDDAIGFDSDAYADLLGDVRDSRVAAVLLAEAHAALADDPRRADALYARAAATGADAAITAVGRARAAWASGRIDAAGTLLDPLPTSTGHAEHERATDLAAAVWAARGLMDTAHAVYRAGQADTGELPARASIAAFAAADADAIAADAAAPAARSMPSALTVALQLLDRGLRATLTGSATTSLTDLVRAAEMYTASGCTDPIPDVPAVIAAVAAIQLGELEVADSVLATAIARQHAGAWAHERLVLWRAWVALQWQRPREVDAALQSVAGSPRPLTPRDRLLADALRVGLARRHSDAAGLARAWRAAADSILRAECDLFGLLPLGELVVTEARLGDTARTGVHFERALAQVSRLGSPPVWSAHLHWCGIQQGILLNRPDALKPHAHALVAAAGGSRVAAAMARAGRVWTSVLAGTVDADAVEESAYALSEIGLAWDGARLAGHGAARTDDRRVISRLLACARQLHPQEEQGDGDGEVVPMRASSHAAALSPREREVAALVLQGLTYAEIGEAIYISPRTAEHHIARIRQRLGATSRSDLIAKLRLAMDGDGDDPRTHTRLEAV